jgi:spermidine synthase
MLPLTASHPAAPCTVQISENDGVRFLHLGGGAVQSAMRLDAPLQLELEYTRAMMGFLLFHQHPRDLCLIGLGGGSLAKFIHRHLPDSRLTALEILPEVVTAAREWFSLPPDDQRLQVSIGDGADYVQTQPESRDVLLVDGYDAEQIAIELTSPAFYRACHAMLRPGGVAVFNLWGSDNRFQGFLDDLAQAFGQHVLQLPAETKANIVVFGFRAPLPDTSFAYLAGRAERLQSDLGMDFDDFLVRMGYCNPCTRNGFLVERALG